VSNLVHKPLAPLNPRFKSYKIIEKLFLQLPHIR